MANIGFLHSGQQALNAAELSAFFKALSDNGYTEGVNLTVYRQFANDDRDNLRPLADTLAMMRNPTLNLIVAAGGSASAKAAIDANNAANSAAPIPIIFTSVSDPVGSGFVGDLDNPGKGNTNNATGVAAFSSELDAARLELLMELLPGKRKFGVLVNSARPRFGDIDDEKKPGEFKELHDFAKFDPDKDLKDANPKSKATKPNRKADIPGAFKFFNDNTYDGVLVTADPLFNDQRAAVLAATDGLPTVYQWREFVDAGGLMSFGPSITECYAQAGVYAAKVLGGAPTASIPIALPQKFELVINIRTAKKLNLRIPASLLSRAIVVQ